MSDEKTSHDWQMLLKSVPHIEFYKFFEDNPSLVWVTMSAEPAQSRESIAFTSVVTP